MHTVLVETHNDDLKRPRSNTDTYSFSDLESAYRQAALLYLQEIDNYDAWADIDVEDLALPARGDFKAFVESMNECSFFEGDYCERRITVSVREGREKTFGGNAADLLTSLLQKCNKIVDSYED